VSLLTAAGVVGLFIFVLVFVVGLLVFLSNKNENAAFVLPFWSVIHFNLIINNFLKCCQTDVSRI